MTQHWTPPTWWRTPEQQIMRARQLWPDAILPELAERFTPRSAFEIPVLHVSDTFDALWDMAVAPPGYTKCRWASLKPNMLDIRLVPNALVYRAPTWVAINPEHGKRIAPNILWGRPNLASSEVLSLLIQCPDWPLAWGNGASAPNLRGYQVNCNEWLDIPFLDLNQEDRKLELGCVDWASNSGDRWASPSVRVI